MNRGFLAFVLIALTMITALVILAVTSNVVLSLGMVGALSIVRFRTAIKEPLDIAFLFWAIAAGIVLATGMIPLAVFGSAVIGTVLLVFVNRRPGSSPYILVLDCTGPEAEAERQAMELVRRETVRNELKSKTVEAEHTEVNAEVRLRDGDTSFIDALSQIPGVTSAVLVSYNGEFTG